MTSVSRVANPRLILGFILICTLVGVTSFIIGKSSSSSQEEALATAQTTLAVYAPAERRTLGATATHNGSVQIPPSQDISYNGSGIVTTVNIQEGDTVRPGTLVATVDSNPVIAVLGSDKPIYRDLHPGDTGYDVEAVQEILNQLGYPLAITGKLDENTEKTLETLYRNIGYTSPCGEKVCVLTGTFLKIPADLPPVTTTSKAGTDTAQDPVLFSANSGNRNIVARIGVAQKEDFNDQPEITVSGPAGEIIRSTDYSFSDFKEGTDKALPGYDLTINLPQDLATIPDDKTVVTLNLNTTVKEYLAVPAVAIRQEGTTTYVLTEDGNRVEVTVLTQAQGWAGIEETNGITEGTQVLVS